MQARCSGVWPWWLRASTATSCQLSRAFLSVERGDTEQRAQGQAGHDAHTRRTPHQPPHPPAPAPHTHAQQPRWASACCAGCVFLIAAANCRCCCMQPSRREAVHVCGTHTCARALSRARARAHPFLGMIDRRVDWVAVPQALRAQRVNRASHPPGRRAAAARSRACRGGPHGAAPCSRTCRAR
jgi:hypothetical protein